MCRICKGNPNWTASNPRAHWALNIIVWHTYLRMKHTGTQEKSSFSINSLIPLGPLPLKMVAKAMTKVLICWTDDWFKFSSCPQVQSRGTRLLYSFVFCPLWYLWRKSVDVQLSPNMFLIDTHLFPPPSMTLFSYLVNLNSTFPSKSFLGWSFSPSLSTSHIIITHHITFYWHHHFWHSPLLNHD